jgi:hypothetical protein
MSTKRRRPQKSKGMTAKPWLFAIGGAVVLGVTAFPTPPSTAAPTHQSASAGHGIASREQQVAQAAYDAGFRGEVLVTMIAIGMTEDTDLDPNAVSPPNHDGTRDRGIWQINSVNADILATGNWRNVKDNARMAYAIWKRQGLKAWSTYSSGKYRAHLSKARILASGVR